MQQSPTQLELGSDGLLGDPPTDPESLAAVKSPLESLKDLEVNAEGIEIRKRISHLHDKTLDMILNMQVQTIGDLATQQQLIGELRGLGRFEVEIILRKERIKEDYESHHNLTTVNEDAGN